MITTDLHLMQRGYKITRNIRNKKVRFARSPNEVRILNNPQTLQSCYIVYFRYYIYIFIITIQKSKEAFLSTKTSLLFLSYFIILL